MKKLILLSYILLMGTCSRAQNYIPFPDSGAIWVNTISQVVNTPFIHCELWKATNFCADGIDTTINSITYTRIDSCEGGYKGALRDDNGKVYYVPTDSTTEFLLYDFTAQAGDTLMIYYEFSNGSGELFQYIVGWIDSIEIYGEFHKVIYPEFGGPGWIEGVGNSYGLFAEPFDNISGWCSDLQCMSINDSTYYPYEGTGSCYLGVGLNENEFEQLSIYPNPSIDGKITIDIEDFSSELSYHIITPNGQTVQKGSLNYSQTSIELKSGTYFIQIANEQQVLTKKIIIP